MIAPAPAVTRWERWALAALLALTAAINGLGLNQYGFGNVYYAAAVASMAQNWHNFFFVAFDPVGFIAVDKPPLGFWLQAASVKLFGFSGVALLVPQAVAGTLAVLVLVVLVRATFGAAAGLLAGTALALSPINVVVNRDNLLESPLILVSLLALGAAIQAVRRDHWRWSVAAGALIGLGFMIKMLEAYLVLPACLAIIAGASSLRWSRRLALGAVLLGLTIAVSFAWPLIVDLVPAVQRPYVGSTTTNSELALAFNYNGVQRLVGQPLYGKPPRPASPLTGPPGPWRVLQAPLGGQMSWWLPIALVGLLTTIWTTRRGRDQWWRLEWADDTKGTALLGWGTWLATTVGFFSVAQFFNPYYLAVALPALCALAGIGVVGLVHDWRHPGWRGWLLPLAVALTGAEQSVILAAYPAWHPWLRLFVAGATVVGTAALVGVRLRVFRSSAQRRAMVQVGAASLVMACLLAAPLLWLAASYTDANEGGFPIAGPAAVGQGNTGAITLDPRLVAYLVAQRGAARFLAATTNTAVAAPLIVVTGAPVMALGGFSGYDPTLTPAQLASRVVRGDVRFFLLPASNLTAPQATALYPHQASAFASAPTNALTGWVAQHCSPVAPQLWQTVVQLGPLQLFDCGAPAP